MESSSLLLCSRKINEIIPQSDRHTDTHTHTHFLHISSLLHCCLSLDFLISRIFHVYQAFTHMLSHFSCVQLFATLWTVACQAALPTGFCKQEHWSGLPCPLPGDLLDPGIEPVSPQSPALAGGLSTTRATWEALVYCNIFLDIHFLKFLNSQNSNFLFSF